MYPRRRRVATGSLAAWPANATDDDWALRGSFNDPGRACQEGGSDTGIGVPAQRVPLGQPVDTVPARARPRAGQPLHSRDLGGEDRRITVSGRD